MAIEGKTERLLKSLDKYCELRKSTLRSGVYLCVTSLVLALLSRNPTWAPKDPTETVQFVWHPAYSAIFGPLIIFALFANFFLALRELLQMRSKILQSQIELSPSESAFTPAELCLLRAPFDAQSEETHQWALKAATLGRYFVYFGVPIISYWFLLVDFFEFRRRDATQANFWDLLFGTCGWGGFPPKHARYPDTPQVPWIYPPFQTWLYIGCFVLLIWFTFSAILALRGNDFGVLHALWRRFSLRSWREWWKRVDKSS